MNDRLVFATLLVLLFMAASVHAQIESAAVRQQSVTRTPHSQVVTTQVRSNSLATVLRNDMVKGNSILLQRKHAGMTYTAYSSLSHVVQRAYTGRIYADLAVIPAVGGNVVRSAVKHHSKKQKARLIAKPENDRQKQHIVLLSPQKEETQLGKLYALKTLLPQRELLALIEQKNVNASPLEMQKLDTFRLELLHEMLWGEPEKVEENAHAILTITPEDKVARAALGWWYYNKQRFEEAYSCFKQLNSEPSPTTEHIEGLIYVLMKLERLDDALQVAQLNKDDLKIAALQKDIMLKILWGRVNALPADSPELEKLAEDILQISPNEEAIRVVRGWWNYNRQEYGKAYEEFNALYLRNPNEKGYPYALASSLVQLKRYDEAVEIASKNKLHDERLIPLESDIYRDKAKIAYAEKRYAEASVYFAKVLEVEPEDQDVKDLLESSRYRQTFIAEILSPIIGLPGSSYASLSHSLKGPGGTGVSGVLSQGIDLVKLPWDLLLRSYGEVWYRTRSEDPTYYDISGRSFGVELKKSLFRLGAEYESERYLKQEKSNAGVTLFLGWYYDWYKYTYDRSDEAGWLNIHSFSGSTSGKLSQDLGGSTGTAVSGSATQGVNWALLPGEIMLNSFMEYRYSFRTRDNLYYNEHGPAVGTELQKMPVKLGIEFYLEHDTEQNRLVQRTSLYLKGYFSWNLKSNK